MDCIVAQIAGLIGISLIKPEETARLQVRFSGCIVKEQAPDKAHLRTKGAESDGC
jgi:hypothetical protein